MRLMVNDCRSPLVSRTGASPSPHVTATAIPLQSLTATLLRYRTHTRKLQCIA